MIRTSTQAAPVSAARMYNKILPSTRSPDCPAFPDLESDSEIDIEERELPVSKPEEMESTPVAPRQSHNLHNRV